MRLLVQCEGVGGLLGIPVKLKTKEEELKREKHRKEMAVSALCCLLCFSLCCFIKKKRIEFFS